MYHSYLRCDKVESADIFLLILYSFFLIFTAVLEPNQIVSDNWMRKTMAQVCLERTFLVTINVLIFAISSFVLTMGNVTFPYQLENTQSELVI